MRAPSGPYRLPYGGQVDRTRKIFFRFDGKTYIGHPGDTLASALLANGVHTLARSFKFHRPRGIFSCGAEEPSALVEVGEGSRTIPSARATMIELTEDLQARSQEGWPSVDFDIGRVLDLTARLWAAGFYNKTFIWPSWHTYEPAIRRMAGLGRAPAGPDPDRYEVHNLHCDVLVVGGCTAGIHAAIDAGREGKRVVLAEQQSSLGGRHVWDSSLIEGRPASKWMPDALGELRRLEDVRVMMRTSAVGIHDHGVVTLWERDDLSRCPLVRERYWIVRTQRVVLATGAIEQPLIFTHNDRPGIMLASAAREYLHRYGVAPGRRVLVATNNDSAYALAVDLKKAGVAVLALVDSRHRRNIPEALRVQLRQQFIDLIADSIPTGASGFSRLKSVTVARLSQDGQCAQTCRTFKCDALAVSGGFAPALQLYAQGGGRLAYEEDSGVLQPQTSHPSINIVGSAAEKVAAGPRVSPVGNKHRQWVDLAHDVTVGDLELAHRENYTSIEHVKRYTTVGMAADQGKTSHAATLEIIGKLRALPAADLGHTTLRPPVVPVTLGAIAGRDTGERFAPARYLPMHEWHVSHGAVCQDFGTWQRPVAYVRGGESREQAAHREALAVRTAVGLFDASSLGKIEIQGPDSLEFLDRFYINNLKTLQPGRTRYGLMLRETGTLFDDGTVIALSPAHLLITTTSSNAARVYQWLDEWHQCEWPHLRVVITPVTEQWATIALAGPAARKVLTKLDTDIDLSPKAFPHLGMRQGMLLGQPARIYRVSFTGELTFEINVPADSGVRIWEALLEAGAAHGLEPFGMDALMRLRLEKANLHIGTDTDGTTIPEDVGWGQVAAKKTSHYIGKRSLSLPAHLNPDRFQLVGLRPVTDAGGLKWSAGAATLYHSSLSADGPASTQPFVIGSHLRLPGSMHATDGWVSSAGSTIFGGVPIALALLRRGRAQDGTEVALFDGGMPVGRAKVITGVFYNAGAERMHA